MSFPKGIKVLFITNKVPHYRLPLYEELGQNVNLSIAHYGAATNSEFFREFICQAHSLGPFLTLHGRFDTSKYDVLILWGNLRLINIYRYAISHNRRQKVILFGPGVSSSYTKYYDNSRITSFVTKFLLKRLDAAVFYDNYPVIKYSALGINPSKLFVAYNTVNETLSTFGGSYERDSFLFIGTVYKEKGLDILLEAYLKISKSGVTNLPRLNIVGDGPDLVLLNNWVKENKLDGVIEFHGRIIDSKILEPFFLRAIACVSPLQAGLSVQKCFAHGVPFITSKYPITGGEFTSILHNKTGLFFDGTSNGLIDALKIMAGKNQVEINEMSMNCQLFYQKFRSPEVWLSGFQQAISFVTTKKN